MATPTTAQKMEPYAAADHPIHNLSTELKVIILGQSIDESALEWSWPAYNVLEALEPIHKAFEFDMMFLADAVCQSHPLSAEAVFKKARTVSCYAMSLVGTFEEHLILQQQVRTLDIEIHAAGFDKAIQIGTVVEKCPQLGRLTLLTKTPVRRYSRFTNVPYSGTLAQVMYGAPLSYGQPPMTHGASATYGSSLSYTQAFMSGQQTSYGQPVSHGQPSTYTQPSTYASPTTFAFAQTYYTQQMANGQPPIYGAPPPPFNPMAIPAPPAAAKYPGPWTDSLRRVLAKTLQGVIAQRKPVEGLSLVTKTPQSVVAPRKSTKNMRLVFMHDEEETEEWDVLRFEMVVKDGKGGGEVKGCGNGKEGGIGKDKDGDDRKGESL